jgi:hypothetical protein
MSRMPHQPTPDLRQHVRSLAGVGVPQEDISKLIGCSEKTLRHHYREELDEGAEEANVAVVGFLMDAIDNSNVTAMIFFEKCRGGQHEEVPKEASLHKPFMRLPCNGVGVCTLRDVAFYMPGEECWSPTRSG